MAESHHSREAEPAPAGAHHEGRQGAKRARVLVVDDNDDVRQMMAVALQTHGHAVVEAADAGEAIRHLREGSFDVVLTDYELPDQTGTTLLKEAAASGLLGHATALIVTARTQPEGTEGFSVIPKPIDLDRLMAQVRGVVESSALASSAPAATDAAPAVELVLYVADGSAASTRARRCMDAVLRRFVGCPIRYAVRDVAEEPARAEEDQIVFAPTLVKRSPGPRAWVLGDLADTAVVVDLLKVCGLTPTS